MTRNKCKVCNNALFEEPLLNYCNMPVSAQYLPDSASLKKDKSVDLHVYQCSSCGLVQLNNDPVPYYKEVIRAAAFSEEMKKFRIKQFKNFIEKYALAGKSIIEIGCGRGEYLEIMNQLGVTTYGLEWSEEAVKKCINSGLKVSLGFVENKDSEIANAPFDSFFMLNFLEHLPDPNSTLKGIHNNLKDGAIGIVEVPNFDMMLQKDLFSEFITDHIFYFTKETLETTLRLNGFEVIDCTVIWNDYILSAIVKKKGKLKLNKLCEHKEKINAEIKEYINTFSNKKVAIWGAGHQALTMIAFMNLSDKIKYVVDSATFKQGKYTPATHIPIVSPEVLNSDPVEAIIVMAAGYSDEVAQIIQTKYKNINIAILRDFGLEEYTVNHKETQNG